MRVAILVIVATVRMAHAECTDRATADAAQAKAEVANEARYDAALKRQKLTHASLEASVADEGTDGTARSARTRAGTVVTHGSNKVLVLDTPVMTCGGVPAPEFVSDGKKVFRVERRQRPGTVTRLAVCACDGRATGCGARPSVAATGVVLPAGQSYGGVKRIEYIADNVIVSFGATNGGPCPEPPARK